MNLKFLLVILMFFEFNVSTHSQSIASGGLENFKINSELSNSQNFKILKNVRLFSKIKLDSDIKNIDNLFTYKKSFLNPAESDDSEPSLFIVANGGYLNEIEENYSTASIYQKYGVNKTFSEKFNMGLIFRIEYAKREEVDIADQNRWYDNTTLNANYSFNPFNNVSAFAGLSVSDTTFTTYGIKYNTVIANEDFLITNNLTLSDDYFYYWNQVTQIFASDNVNFNYKNLSLSAEAFYGVVNFDYIDNYEAKARNPNTLFAFDVQYLLLPDPAIKVGAAISNRNFKYRSPLYYSPSNKNQIGVFSSIYKAFGKIYFYLGGSTNVDNQNTFIWSVDSELGYDYNNFSASIGLGRYNDPYYTNYNTFINLSKNF